MCRLRIDPLANSFPQIKHLNFLLAKICEKGFTANGHLKRHIHKYHPQQTLEDDIQMIVEQEQNIENEMPIVNFVTNQDTVETATVEVASTLCN
jgi:PII-like signaling protein